MLTPPASVKTRSTDNMPMKRARFAFVSGIVMVILGLGLDALGFSLPGDPYTFGFVTALVIGLAAFFASGLPKRNQKN